MPFLDIARILVDVVFVIFYVTFGIYAIIRLRRSKRSSRLTDSTTMSRYFFYFLPVHCIARLQEILLRSKLFDSGFFVAALNTGTVKLTYTALPSGTFMIVLYIYLRVWQLQEHELTISSPYKNEFDHHQLMEIKKSHVFLWGLSWGIALGLDFMLNYYNYEDNLYASYAVFNLNFLVISAAFFYLGSKMHTALELPWEQDAKYVGTFESHIRRMKWLFGVSCFVRVASNMLEVSAYAILQTNAMIFNASVFVVEVVPLAAAVLSMAIVEHRMNVIEPSLIQEHSASALVQ